MERTRLGDRDHQQGGRVQHRAWTSHTARAYTLTLRRRPAVNAAREEFLTARAFQRSQIFSICAATHRISMQPQQAQGRAEGQPARSMLCFCRSLIFMYSLGAEAQPVSCGYSLGLYIECLYPI